MPYKFVLTGFFFSFLVEIWIFILGELEKSGE